MQKRFKTGLVYSLHTMLRSLNFKTSIYELTKNTEFDSLWFIRVGESGTSQNLMGDNSNQTLRHGGETGMPFRLIPFSCLM